MRSFPSLPTKSPENDVRHAAGPVNSFSGSDASNAARLRPQRAGLRQRALDLLDRANECEVLAGIAPRHDARAAYEQMAEMYRHLALSDERVARVEAFVEHIREWAS